MRLAAFGLLDYPYSKAFHNICRAEHFDPERFRREGPARPEY